MGGGGQGKLADRQKRLVETKEQEIRTARDFSKGTLEARSKPFRNSTQKMTSNLDFYYSIFMGGKSGGSMIGVIKLLNLLFLQIVLLKHSHIQGRLAGSVSKVRNS